MPIVMDCQEFSQRKEDCMITTSAFKKRTLKKRVKVVRVKAVFCMQDVRKRPLDQMQLASVPNNVIF